MIGRKRRAGRGGSPRAAPGPAAFGIQGEIDHQDRVLLDDADQQDHADQRDEGELDVEHSSSASTAPTPAEGRVDRIVSGWM